MPTIYDNIENYLDKGLLKTIENSYRADFCVGYFYLKGWKILQDKIDKFEGEDNCCRLLVGMQKPAEETVRELLLAMDTGQMDASSAVRMRKQAALEFRQQLVLGLPTTEDLNCLQKLKGQLVAGKVKVKLFLKHSLHAKLYLLFRNQEESLKGYVGSSNLTLSGLSKQGELNVDVVEQDTAKKLSEWFNARWEDKLSFDISKDLIDILDESWASEKPILPYYIYLKIAWHLSQEARSGINNYMIPKIFLEGSDALLPYQENAVSIAARHLDKRGGVLIGDVVGLGKTLTATAVAKVFEDSFFTQTLIVCPKNLVDMWEGYVHKYGLHAKVISISTINADFKERIRMYGVVIIDESHNLRNRQGKTYGLLKDYLHYNGSKVILLTATPYNKTYYDISNQLRLFLPEDLDLGLSPERFIRDVGGNVEFTAKYQYLPNTLLAFEKSSYAEDWQELLRLYMVRRTRSFIKATYAEWDAAKKQHFLTFRDGRVNYFPDRIPRTVSFPFDPADKKDLFVQLYSDDVVSAINALHLARYGLGNYIDAAAEATASAAQREIAKNLSRAGKRLMGFCRTNLFKRLESCGLSFLISLARHALKNAVFIYAIKHGKPFPIGPQESADMDEFMEEAGEDDVHISLITDPDEYRKKAATQYTRFEGEAKRYKWIDSALFSARLKRHLQDDIDAILRIIEVGKNWNPKEDKKLTALYELCSKKHKKEKLLIFTQFADTARYLNEQLGAYAMNGLAMATGGSDSPTEIAYRFSPHSNIAGFSEERKARILANEVRILIATDVLSEGQNLQDAHIVVNYDLPWALIRLIQRAGRVDRIGQQHNKIYCYSFIPQDGVDRIISLRRRLRERISENSEVVGSDEVFFDGDPVNIKDLYNEKSGILDGGDDGEVDLTSQAYEIWNSAIKANPELKKIIPALPDVAFSTKGRTADIVEGEGVITYHRNSHNYEVLTWMDTNGKVISHSQARILKVAACSIEEAPLEPLLNHLDLVGKAVKDAEEEAARTGGQLGSQSSARYKAYGMLKRYYEGVKNTLFDTDALKKAVDEIYQFPLRESARDIINRRLRMSITDEALAELCIRLRDEAKLCVVDNAKGASLQIPHIICSLGIKNA